MELEGMRFSSNLLKPVFGLCLAATAALVLLAACRDKRPTVSKTQPIQVANSFVGNEDCRECHPNAFEEHRDSRHNMTLRRMDRQELGKQSPPVGKIPNSAYSLVSMGNGFGFGLTDGPKHQLQLVFGSGKSGMAFASIPAAGVFAEARMSFYPATRRWFITPGQQNISDRVIGNMMRGKPARQCLECHTVTLPADTLMPEKKFFGVGCESCHGAGGAHVAAMRAGDLARLQMPKLKTMGGAAMNDLCGRCHRTEKAVIENDLEKKHTNLFQAHGLAQSACFRKSKDRLTCITCHAPHRDASTDERSYVKTCLSCHGSSQSTPMADAVAAKVCPVNPSDKCVGCHMPKINESLFPGQPRNIADHYIRVHRASEALSRSASRRE